MKHFSVKCYSLFSKTQFISLVVALLGGLVLFLSNAHNNLSAAIAALAALDPTRADFVTALCIAFIAALVGALANQSRSYAIGGAVFAFLLCYLARFVYTALQPTYDPAGNLELLSGMALFSRSLTIAALAFICSFIGAAIGNALAQVVLAPLVRPLKALWMGKRNEPTPFQPLFLIREWVKAFTLVALFSVAMESGNLFLYSPDINLHIASNTQLHGSTKLDHFVDYSNQAREFWLYLPPSYYQPQARQKRYPVLYLLHGTPGTAKDWLVGGLADTSADTLISKGGISELIMVMPDGNNQPGKSSEWADSYDRTQLLETSVSEELVRYVDQHYRTLANAQHRAIGGLSTGGFGAMNIAIHHPNIFHSVISLGGYYIAEEDVWGNNAAYQQANSPLITISQNQQAHKLHIYLGAATKDQPYYNDTSLFAKTLGALHIPYTFDLEPGHHSWSVWRTQLFHALPWLSWKA